MKLDLTRDEISKTVEDFSKQDHSQSEMCILVVMSHGGNGYLLGSDIGPDGKGKIVFQEDLLNMIERDAAPQLDGKPKLFIFNNCRYMIE